MQKALGRVGSPGLLQGCGDFLCGRKEGFLVFFEFLPETRSDLSHASGLVFQIPRHLGPRVANEIILAKSFRKLQIEPYATPVQSAERGCKIHLETT
jgi:hypothetical protein